VAISPSNLTGLTRGGAASARGSAVEGGRRPWRLAASCGQIPLGAL